MKSCQGIEIGLRATSIAEESDDSLYFSDAEDEPWRSPCGSHYCNQGSSCASIHGRGGAVDSCRNFCMSDSSMGSVDLENGVSEVEATPDKSERDCRICHLSLEIQTQESGVPFVLGCSCKDDLAAAHKKCAETWFKIKGNKTCEICGSAVENVAVAVQAGSTETETADGNRNDAVEASTTDGRRRHFWQGGHRFINALLACVVFALVISWLFHFDVPG